jgi:hypothetical protein
MRQRAFDESAFYIVELAAAFERAGVEKRREEKKTAWGREKKKEKQIGKSERRFLSTRRKLYEGVIYVCIYF